MSLRRSPPSAIEDARDTVYTEDMQHGRAIGGVTIRNPFVERAADTEIPPRPKGRAGLIQTY